MKHNLIPRTRQDEFYVAIIELLEEINDKLPKAEQIKLPKETPKPKTKRVKKEVKE